jgi:hypothetical protein
MEILLLLLSGYMLFLLTWVFYLALMNLKKVRHSLHPVAKAQAYVLLFIGYILDVVLNVTVGTVLYADLPRELLFTSRLQRLKRKGGWRGDMARWMCDHLLNQFDVGHC